MYSLLQYLQYILWTVISLQYIPFPAMHDENKTDIRGSVADRNEHPGLISTDWLNCHLLLETYRGKLTLFILLSFHKLSSSPPSPSELRLD